MDEAINRINVDRLLGPAISVRKSKTYKVFEVTSDTTVDASDYGVKHAKAGDFIREDHRGYLEVLTRSEFEEEYEFVEE